MKFPNMKANWILIAISTSFLALCNVASGVDLHGDYVLVSANLGNPDFDPHTLDAVSARISKQGDHYEITIDDILGNEPVTVPLHVEGSRVSFFLPPRKFARDGKELFSIAKAYFGEIVADLYIAGRMTYGKRLDAFKLKRVKPLPETTPAN